MKTNTPTKPSSSTFQKEICFPPHKTPLDVLVLCDKYLDEIKIHHTSLNVHFILSECSRSGKNVEFGKLIPGKSYDVMSIFKVG